VQQQQYIHRPKSFLRGCIAIAYIVLWAQYLGISWLQRSIVVDGCLALQQLPTIL
jgi:hypothetical protein